MEYEVKTTEKVVKPKGEQVFSINATTIRIEDEVAGEFVTLSQSGDEKENTIAIEKEDWELIKGVVDEMMKTVEAGK